MEDRSSQVRSNKPSRFSRFRGFLQWATTPPQAIAVYLICFILVAGLSFYVGTLNPKKGIGRGLPPPVTVPRN
jgi:hypothetical protein